MQQKYSFGPRGWAMLTLVGGVTLAAPFLRPARVDVEGLTSKSPMSPINGLGPFAASESTAKNRANISSTSDDSMLIDGFDF